MKRTLGWLFMGYLCLIMQSVLLPLVLPSSVRPDVMLIVLLMMALLEPVGTGVLLACLLGAFQDVFVGSHFGLYGFVFPLFYLCVRFVVAHLNFDSGALFPMLCLGGTILLNGLVLFCLIVFADHGAAWQIVGRNLPLNLLCNGLIGLLVAGPVMAKVRQRRAYEA